MTRRCDAIELSDRYWVLERILRPQACTCSNLQAEKHEDECRLNRGRGATNLYYFANAPRPSGIAKELRYDSGDRGGMKSINNPLHCRSKENPEHQCSRSVGSKREAVKRCKPQPAPHVRLHASHPFTGVRPRKTQYAYPEYASTTGATSTIPIRTNFWLADEAAASHSVI